MLKYLNNTNAIWGQVYQPKTSNNKITYYGDYHVYGNIDISQFTDKVLVWHKPEFPKEEWRYGLYGIKYKPEWDYVKEEDVMTIELPQLIYTPVYIEKYYIYDVFYNDNGEYVIIIPQIPDDNSPPASIKLNGMEFKLIICNSNLLKLYKLKEAYNKTIQLQINNEIIDTKVNKYPEFPDEIIMTTMVKNEDNYIRQWIDYHYKLGINRFIIYDNCEIDDKISYNSSELKSNLPKILKDYIDNNIVILIRWIYKKRILPTNLVKKTNNFDYHNNDIKDIDNEISKYISGQTTQQTHSIQAFKKSKYIGLFDVDEYINPQKDNNILNLINNIINKNKIDTTKISSFIFPYKFFYNPHNLPEDGTKFLKIYNCSKIYQMPWPKLIIIPANVDIVEIHYISKGKKAYQIDEEYAYFNHYYFLNKHNRGRKCTEFVDKSILKHII
jgi:hypothetical protein